MTVPAKPVVKRRRIPGKPEDEARRVRRLLAAGLVTRRQIRLEDALAAALDRLTPAQRRALFGKRGMT